jgi:hypothetical protein
MDDDSVGRGTGITRFCFTLYFLTFFLDKDTAESDYLDGDDNTLGILSQIFNKAVTPPPEQPGPSRQNNDDTSATPDQDNGDVSATPNQDLPVASNNDVSHEPGLNLPVASPLKGRGHRYVTCSLTQLTLTFFVQQNQEASSVCAGDQPAQKETES